MEGTTQGCKLTYIYKKIWQRYIEIYVIFMFKHSKKNIQLNSNFSVFSPNFYAESALQRLEVYYGMFASPPCLITEANLRIHKFQRPCRVSIMHQRFALIISN